MIRWSWLALLVSMQALAAEGEEEPPAEVVEAPAPEPEPPAPAPLTGRRDLPDYDGRPDVTTPGETALWVPRVLMFPLWLPTEYLLHKPLGWLIPLMEESHAINHVTEFLTFGRSDEFFLVPIVTIDTTMRTSVGLYFAVEDFPGSRDRLSILGTYAGERGRHLSIVDRMRIRPEESEWGEQDYLRIELDHQQRPDHPYFGYGATQTSTRTRYFRSQTMASATLLWHFGELDRLHAGAEVGENRFGTGGDVRELEDPSVDEEYDISRIPGFDGFRILAANIGGDFDTRRPRPEHGSGARAEMWARVATGESADGEVPFTMLRYGGQLSLHLDLTGHNRVLAAGVRAEQAAPVRGEVPFVELASLGGGETMHAFAPDRFLGPSTLYIPVRYTWPIAVFTDGQLFWEMGGSYGDALDGLSFDTLHASFGFGARARFERDSALDLTVAWGTPPLGEGFKVEVFRLNAALTRGF